jgi:glutamate-ammonia-ligase adenylyltransferase
MAPAWVGKKLFRDAERAKRNCDALIAQAGALWAPVEAVLRRELPRTADADMALNNLERLFAVPAALVQLPVLLEARGRGLDATLQLLATSQFFADTLILYPEALDIVRAAPRRNPSTEELTGILRADIEAAYDDTAVLRAFRRYRQLQTLRVGVNDILRDRPLEEITRDLARIADSSLKVALQTALKNLTKKLGMPMTPAGQPSKVVALAFGKLGGDELNYSSDIDLMFVYDEDGETSGRRAGSVPNSEFYSRVVVEVIRLLASQTDRGFAYRVDLRLRPEGHSGPLARSLASTLSYYDVMGRTWERQALIKLRHVAGDSPLGKQVVKALQPFVYRKYFSFSEINEVKALKRQMEQRATRAGIDEQDVKTGRGGIRDIEFAVQFLQLLNGGDLPAVRQRNTLLALEALEIAGCLNPQETFILADAYRFLRKTEHRLQLLFDWQTHRLPSSTDELRKLALRMGYREASREAEEEAPPAVSEFPAQRRSPLDELPDTEFQTRDLLLEPLELFLKDFHDKTAVNRTILDHLLHQTFAEPEGQAEPESDLILDPNPDEAAIRATLGRYPFRDIPAAYLNLDRLAQESVPFLSHRRCRHFLASIAPQLLRAIAATADPDAALNDFERVTASLGAKAVLYELFSFNPPTLKLFVDLCANSPYLSSILINNAGMEDQLLDSLVLDQPRRAGELTAELNELLRGASDPDPILRSFQDNEFLRIGVRDLLGKADIRETTGALSDVADTILNGVFDLVEPGVSAKFGVPSSPMGEGHCRYALLGLGKLGGREISYHSDLDLLLIYEADGQTHSEYSNATTNHHYFTELVQRAIRMASRTGPLGRLYEVDMRLRPTGKSGSLVLPLDEFRKYFAGPGSQLWERQSLTRARSLRGCPEFVAEVTVAVRNAVLGKPWCPQLADEIRTMRSRMEASASPRSLKRAAGGLVDVEFLVQLLILRSGRDRPEIVQSNIWEALDALERAELLPGEQIELLREGYSFLRFVEARLRIVTDRPLTEIPENHDDLEKLARRAGFEGAIPFGKKLASAMTGIRSVFQSVIEG